MSRRVIVCMIAAFIALDAIVLGLYWFMQGRASARSPASQAQSTTASPTPSRERLDEGYLLQRERKLPEAVAVFEAIIRDEPDNSDAYHGLAQAQRETGDLVTAMSNHDRAIQLNPQRYDLYWERGVTCQRMKDDAGAISNYEACLERKPSFANAHLGLGEIYRSKGDMDKSLKHLDQAIALKPDSDWFYRERGNTHQKMGNQQLAEADFAKMRELQESKR
jgi:tetratricopeptide (TPR) repeat protein